MKPASPNSRPQPALIDPLIIGIGVVILILDQWTKSLAIANLGPDAARHSVDVIGDVLRFSYTTNTGAAFGMLPGGINLFRLVSLAAVPLFLFAPRLLGLDGLLTRIVVGMLLGGNLGNLVDRFLLGHVTDFIDMGIGDLRFWTYNIADASFVIGVTIFAIYMLFFAPPEPEDAAAEPTKAPSPTSAEPSER